MTISSRSDFHDKPSDQASAAKLPYEVGLLVGLALVGLLLSYFLGFDANYSPF